MDKFTEGIFHVHSNYSHDGRISLVQLKTGCLRRGLKFVLLTEHARGFDHEKFSGFVSECNMLSDENILLVPGLEFDFAEQNDAHVLLTGLKTFPEGIAIDQIIDAAHRQSSLIIVAHPARNDHHIPESVLGAIDGIEVWNAAYNSRYLPDEKAILLLRRLRNTCNHLIGIGGLDLHGIEGFRGLRLRMKNGFEDSADLISHIKNGRFTIRGTFLAFRPEMKIGFMYLYLLRILRMLLNTIDNIRIYVLHRMRQLRNKPAQRVVS